MREGGIGAEGALEIAWYAGTTSGPDTARQTKTIVGSPWVNIAKGGDCSFTNDCNRGRIKTPMSVVNKAFSNVPKGCRNTEALGKCKSLTPSQRLGDKKNTI